MELSKKLNKEIIKYIEAHPVLVEFDYRDELSNKQIAKILEDPENGIGDLENELYEYNIDYLSEQSRYFLEEDVYNYFKDELTEHYEQHNPEESEEWIEREIKDFLNDNYRGYISEGVDIDSLINRTGEILSLVVMYSNYDCTNSFDTLETSDYLAQVYQRVKAGVRKKDFIWEHINGAYGGSLFCFGFRCELTTLIEMKKNLKKAKRLFIPKGTQFGFFSSFQGSGSVFEKTTYRNMYINVKETGKFKTTDGRIEDLLPEYDSIDIIADCEQHYSVKDVYGCTNDIFDSQDIELSGADL